MTRRATSAEQDLAEQVHDYMVATVTDNAMSGFTVHRHLGDGTAAITYRPGIVPAYAAVLRWTLTTWAGLLREAGFVVEVDIRDDHGQVDVPQALRILGRVERRPPSQSRPSKSVVANTAFPALARDIAEQVVRRPATNSTRAQLIDAAIDERDLGHIDVSVREVLHGAVLDALDRGGVA